MAKNKKSSYQKLKEQNQKLLQDIRTLVYKDTPLIKKLETEMIYRLRFEAEDLLWKGYIKY